MDIKQIKESRCISRVIGEYVELHTKGRQLVGLCPFHDDHHPSLLVDIGKQRFACFACGAKGDVFAFVQRIENIPFAEAARKLAGSNRWEAGSSKREAGSLPPTASRLPLTAYLQSLMPYIPPHPELTDTYLAFEVGLSPVEVKPEFKAFSGRIIFPIRNDEGRLVGFAGRAVKEGRAKYINSSLADGFDKSQTLYGLFRAKEDVLRTHEIYLTEGYKDALAMHAAGFTNTVALGGTALTDGHIALLRKYEAEKVFLFLDGDKAGREAADKIDSKLREEGIDTWCITAEHTHDPDSLFREQERSAFANSIQTASRPPVRLRNGTALYNETALQETIKELLRRYRHTTNPQLRYDLLHLLYHRLDQYSYLSHELHRPGML